MSEYQDTTSLMKGLEVIRDFSKSLPFSPGVYRMIGDKGDVLYVGKAKSLKKRVVSYLNYSALPIRLQRMIAQTVTMEFITTHTEVEALLLESNLIKQLKPRFNILLRDDKSFPYILIREDHDFPQVTKHRGARNIRGKYYGPFAGAGDVNRTLTILQKTFLLRTCTDGYFSNRDRPCLQYHIKRCTAPCVGKVNFDEYKEQVSGARDFLDGKSREIQKRMTDAMQQASCNLDYEKAAFYRDRIRALASVQTRQDINIDVKDVDVIALYNEKGKSCVQVFFFRGGQNFGNKSYFPRHDPDEKSQDILGAFIAQFYQSKPVPPAIFVNVDLNEKLLLQEALSAKIDRKVNISVPLRGQRKRLIDFVLRNAQEALERHLLAGAAQQKILAQLTDLFGLEEVPERIEVYDNSHISGTNMVGAMIVAGPEGLLKNSYRKFNIREAEAGDDYGMMREVMKRRFLRALKEQELGDDSNWPDLVMIDGGAGQLSACREALEECGVVDDVVLVAIAKGEDRNAGREKFFMVDREMFQLPINDPVLHYLQRLRDEAHRFAIGTHRARRQKQITSSLLDDISGIGAKRKKALLLYFGSAKAVSSAGIDDLEKVEGISKAFARKIYDHFHG